MTKVLFVCTANVCRSPLAEGYLNALVQKKGLSGINAVSAGIAAFSGGPAFECAVDVARQHLFDLSRHRAQQLTPELGNSVDRILCMETWQARVVMEMDPGFSGKVSLLGRYHPDANALLQIPDPRDFNVPETLRVFEIIQSSVNGLVESLYSNSSDSPQQEFAPSRRERKK